jgi:hypothetical protein
MCKCIIISAWHCHEDLERRVASAIGAQVMIRGPLTQFLCWCDVWVMVDQEAGHVCKGQKPVRRRLEKHEWRHIVEDCSLYQHEWSCLIANRCPLHERGEQSCLYSEDDSTLVREELPVIDSGAPRQCPWKHHDCNLASGWGIRVL